MNNNVFTIIALHTHGYTVQEIAEVYQCYSIETTEDIIKLDSNHHGVAVICGKPSNITVFDFDDTES